MADTLNNAFGNDENIIDINELCYQLIDALKRHRHKAFFDTISESICPIVEKFGYDHKQTLSETGGAAPECQQV